MILLSPYTPNKIREILDEQIDRPPSLMRCILTLNANSYVGTSSVCGRVSANEFELRNRKGPYFSLKAKGKLSEASTGTKIDINFYKPIIRDPMGLIFNRYNKDKQVILSFLKEWIKINGGAEQPL